VPPLAVAVQARSSLAPPASSQAWLMNLDLDFGEIERRDTEVDQYPSSCFEIRIKTEIKQLLTATKK
jgi:hypothetical protein